MKTIEKQIEENNLKLRERNENIIQYWDNIYIGDPRKGRMNKKCCLLSLTSTSTTTPFITKQLF